MTDKFAFINVTLEPLDRGVLFAAHPDPPTGIHLGLTHSAAQCHSRPDTQLGGYGLDRDHSELGLKRS